MFNCCEFDMPISLFIEKGTKTVSKDMARKQWLIDE